MASVSRSCRSPRASEMYSGTNGTPDPAVRGTAGSRSIAPEQGQHRMTDALPHSIEVETSTPTGKAGGCA